MRLDEAIESIRYRIDTASEIIGKGEDDKSFEDLEIAIESLEKQIQLNRCIDELQKLKDLYKEIRKNTYCRRTEMDDCDSCKADHYLEARLSTVDDCIKILDKMQIDTDKDISDYKKEILKEFASRIKSQLLKNNNKMQLYEIDHIMNQINI